jgi:hypothetical protein
MEVDAKRAKFRLYRSSLDEVGLSTAADDALICPLCWQETSFDDLTPEHFVPESVGGKDTVLTCSRCNHDHGSRLDSHLTNYQRMMDAFQGHGSFRTKLNVNGHKLVANLEWLDGHKHFKVIGKATNPSEWNAAHKEFQAGNVSELKCTMYFRYSKKNFERALLRAAYLVAFKCFGYDYAMHDIAQVIRRRIVDPSLSHPRLSSMIIEADKFAPPHDLQHYIIPGNVTGVDFILVVIRVRRATTKYLAVFLPVPGDRSSEFFQLMEVSEKQNNGKTFRIPPERIYY